MDAGDRRKVLLRLRNRLKNKRRRDRLTNEREDLVAQLAEARKQLALLTKKRVGAKTLLSWKDVAQSLSEANDEAAMSLQILREKYECMYRIGCCMHAWVGSMSRRQNVLTPDGPAASTPTVLLADPIVRRLGLDWYTQYMYNNTDRMEHLCAFPAKGSVHDMLIIRHDNGLTDILGRIQVDCNLSLEEAYEVLHDKIWEELRGDTQASMSEFLEEDMVKRIDPKMVYRRTALTAEESNYYVGREFATENRIVFLFGNFSQDVLQPENIQWRPRMYIMDRLAPHRTRIKTVQYNGPKVLRGKVGTWKDELQWTEIDISSLPEDEQFVQYQQSINRHWLPIIESDFDVLSQKRRLQDYYKNKRRRERYLTEKSELLAQLARARKTIDTFARRRNFSTSELPWKDIAGSLAQSCVESRLSLELLRQKYEQVYNISRCMYAWVGSMRSFQNVQISNDMCKATVLMGDPIARRLGLDWFTQHIYYNTNRMEQLCDFPSRGSVCDMTVVEQENGLCEIRGRIQLECSMSMEDVYSHLQDKIWVELRGDTQAVMSEILDEEIVKTIAPKMIYRRTALTADESKYYAAREFVTENRIVFAIGNFSQDALQPQNIQWRPRMYIIDRLSQNRSRIRSIIYNGPKVIEDKIMTWKDDMEESGVDLSTIPAEEQFRRYRQHVLAEWQPIMECDIDTLNVKPKMQSGKSDKQLQEHKRNKRRRERYLSEKSELLAQLARARKTIDTFARRRNFLTSELPWKDIAGSLAQSCVESRLSLVLLRQKYDEVYHISQCMNAWVGTMSRSQNVQGDPITRRLGLDWFSQHIYYNTDRMEQLCEFPFEGTLCDMTVVEEEKCFYEIRGRIQLECFMSMEDLYLRLHDKMWDTLRGDTQPVISELLDEEIVKTIAPKMIYRRTALTADESKYYAAREFVTENRIVFAIGNFSQDALQPQNIQWRPRMYIIDRLGPNRSRIRSIIYNGPKVVEDKIMTWKDDMEESGVDLSTIPTKDQFKQYQQRVLAEWKPLIDCDYEMLNHKRRLRDHLKNKRRRERYLSERSELLAQLARARKALNSFAKRRNVSQSLLPWKDVAQSLEHATGESKNSLDVLRKECEHVYQVARCMSAWVGSMSRSENVGSLDESFTTTELMGDPITRRLGLDWFTQHMYYNTNRMEQLCEFPSEGAIRDMTVVEHDNGRWEIRGRIQVVCNLSLEETYAHLHDKIWDELRGDTQAIMSEFLDEDIVKSIDPKMIYRRTAINVDESKYYAAREFVTKNRVVFAIGNFSQDALQPENALWRPRMYIMDRLDPKRTRSRIIYYNGPKVIRGKVMTWKDDLEELVVDIGTIAETQQFAQYQELVVREWQEEMENDYDLLHVKHVPRVSHE
ncbi:hypothetical protein THRCLA_02355 [Thraustotheca clavata]|uniref:Uncharacterized protein n=1 Tax=Thraustotheca clavata TaxID=74557 RepID=A0A1W0A680_9STRA|nr:hypothetical protein THRCLA_02355 [Thraustotheca clavata]